MITVGHNFSPGTTVNLVATAQPSMVNLSLRTPIKSGSCRKVLHIQRGLDHLPTSEDD